MLPTCISVSPIPGRFSSEMSSGRHSIIGKGEEVLVKGQRTVRGHTGEGRTYHVKKYNEITQREKDIAREFSGHHKVPSNVPKPRFHFLGACIVQEERGREWGIRNRVVGNGRQSLLDEQ